MLDKDGKPLEFEESEPYIKIIFDGCNHTQEMPLTMFKGSTRKYSVDNKPILSCPDCEQHKIGFCEKSPVHTISRFQYLPSVRRIKR
jgi:hypothetical protein